MSAPKPPADYTVWGEPESWREEDANAAGFDWIAFSAVLLFLALFVLSCWWICDSAIASGK